MRHFIRTLKFSWAYRYRLMISVLCAFGVAAFWSINLSAILPVLKILSSDKNLQQWVDEEIEAYRKKANDPVKLAEIEGLNEQIALLDRNPDAVDGENVRRRLTHRERQGQEADVHTRDPRFRKPCVVSDS